MVFNKNIAVCYSVIPLLLILLSDPPHISAEPLILTHEEQQWLDQHPEIRLAVDMDWAPFEYVDHNKNYLGMAADYVRIIEEKLGIAFKIDKERKWPQMVEAVKNRDLDRPVYQNKSVYRSNLCAFALMRKLCCC